MDPLSVWLDDQFGDAWARSDASAEMVAELEARGLVTIDDALNSFAYDMNTEPIIESATNIAAPQFDIDSENHNAMTIFVHSAKHFARVALPASLFDDVVRAQRRLALFLADALVASAAPIQGDMQLQTARIAERFATEKTRKRQKLERKLAKLSE
jgi:hypothetical protein